MQQEQIHFLFVWYNAVSNVLKSSSSKTADMFFALNQKHVAAHCQSAGWKRKQKQCDCFEITNHVWSTVTIPVGHSCLTFSPDSHQEQNRCSQVSVCHTMKQHGVQSARPHQPPSSPNFTDKVYFYRHQIHILMKLKKFHKPDMKWGESTKLIWYKTSKTSTSRWVWLLFTSSFLWTAEIWCSPWTNLSHWEHWESGYTAEL